MNNTVVDAYLKRHEFFLERIIKDLKAPAQRVHDAIHYSLFPGGKRIRPLLVYLIGELVSLPLDNLDVIAAAIELTHCYSLIHDDLPAMDNDDYRRGRLSCHKRFDEATAILAGDGMQALAIDVLLKHLRPMQAHYVVAIIQVLVRASGVRGMVSGQSLDLSELDNVSTDIQTLERIHYLKTGCLISSCVEMVLAAQAPIDNILHHALLDYTKYLGLAFQMQDDYLDAYANEQLGKKRASDKANSKSTFASLFNKKELQHAVSEQFSAALNTLEPFKNQAHSLIIFTEQLAQRSR